MLPPALRRSQWIAIIGVLAVALLIAGYVLLKPEPRRSGTNSSAPVSALATIDGASGPACVRKLALPVDTGGIRTYFDTHGAPAPKVAFTLADAKGRIVRTSSAQGFGSGASPVFTFAAMPQGGGDLTACFRTAGGKVTLLGTLDPNIDPIASFWIGKTPVPGDISLEYMRPGEHSIASMLPTIMQRASLFRPGWFGPWTIWLAFALTLAAIAAAASLLLRLGRGAEWGRGSMVALAAIVFVGSLAWAILTPAFNAPDETAHFAYVEAVARGELPEKTIPQGGSGNAYRPSTALASGFTALPVIQNSFARPRWDKLAERGFQSQYDLTIATANKAYGLTPASSYSPLYYAPAALAYKAAGSSQVFGQLFAVRLFSALLMAISALFVVLLAREILPSVPWFAPVAGLAVAFEPMFLHVGGSVNNDSLLVLLSTATLYLLARMLRRGPTYGTAIGAGALFALGYLAKPTIAGLAAAMAFTFIFLAFSRTDDRMLRIKQLGAGTFAFVALFAIGIATGTVGGATAASISRTAADADQVAPASLWGALSYVWQWFFPALPGMHDFFVGTPPFVGVLVRGFTADFNALDTEFAVWLYYAIALGLLVLTVAACFAAYRRRAVLRERWPLIAMPLTAIVGMVLFVIVTGYLVLTSNQQNFVQGRYLFPAIGVLGLLVAGGSLAAGAKRGLVVASAIVMSIAVLDIFGMGISLARFYI